MGMADTNDGLHGSWTAVLLLTGSWVILQSDECSVWDDVYVSTQLVGQLKLACTLTCRHQLSGVSYVDFAGLPMLLLLVLQAMRVGLSCGTCEHRSL